MEEREQSRSLMQPCARDAGANGAGMGAAIRPDSRPDENAERSAPRLHIDRTAGRDRHCCGVGGLAVARVGKGQGEGARDWLRQQYQATLARLAALCRRELRFAGEQSRNSGDPQTATEL